MRTEQSVSAAEPVRLADYRPPAFLVETAELTFRLHPTATRVLAKLAVRRNPDPEAPGGPLLFNGHGLTPIAVAVDGRPAPITADVAGPDRLRLLHVPDAFTLETEVEINPSANTALSGLYLSGGRFCTQCEAEGFRAITYFPDRPDVLTRYTVRVEAPDGADASGEAYRLLSNGNPVEAGRDADGRRYAVWTDPFLKPCYLFALVAGELDELQDSFTTASGRPVDLRVYVDPGQVGRAGYAMDALKRSMAFDERAFGREYDLDLFQIVAVRDFNMGAMENKGLNIFNSSLLLADPESATDADYERIERVVAHEYFHNWTGNRITCRDWFQLCLKEGLTVYRDQAFTQDQRGFAVQRIKDVKVLRGRQFPEDAGPLSHPVRPRQYLKIDNFYTATVYEKGAEVVRMLRTLLGDEGFRAGLDLYFDRHDGTATTVEAFIACFAEASGRDLADFFRWYEQAGTPTLTAVRRYDAEAGVLELSLTVTPPAPGAAAPPLPVRWGAVAADGRELAAGLAVVDGAATVRVEGVDAAPAVSLLRGFSAPVRLVDDATAADRLVLLAHDTDLFTRWEAGQALAEQLILARAYGAADAAGEAAYAEAVGAVLADDGADPAFNALVLTAPAEGDLALARQPADPAALNAARDALRAAVAGRLRGALEALHDAMADDGPFSPDAAAAGRRSLRSTALMLLTAAPDAAVVARAEAQRAAATNMTDTLGALNALLMLQDSPGGAAALEAALAAFYDRWKDDPLVLDKWFSLQARDPSPAAVGRVLGLTSHPKFDHRNPNRARSLIEGFSHGNPARFHSADGSGYRFLADQILSVDALNPQTAARMVEPLGGWRRYRHDLGVAMRAQLERIAAHHGLSANVGELAAKALG